MLSVFPWTRFPGWQFVIGGTIALTGAWSSAPTRSARTPSSLT